MTPTQIPHSSKPPLLNAPNIELLASPHKKNRVQEFVVSQTRYAKAQANEGRAVRASWEITTPEKDKMRLHLPSAGFETPVLRPRTAQIPAESNPEVLPSSPPRLKSLANKPTTSMHSPGLAGKAMATPAVREVFSPKRQKGPEEKSTAKNSGTSNPTRKERRARSDSDEEHLGSTGFSFPVIHGVPPLTGVTGLTERRESKRARHDIMNPRENRAGSRGEKENKKDRKNELNDKKKHRIPAGLALMHGFSSTNVGKTRLTVRENSSIAKISFSQSRTDRTAAKFRCIQQGQSLREDKSRRVKTRETKRYI